MITMIGFHRATKTYGKWPLGIESNGDQYIHLMDFNDDRKYHADCYFQTNILKPKFLNTKFGKDIIGIPLTFIRNSGKPVLVSESNVFRETNGYRRIGWNSYLWTDGNFNNDNVGPERWNKFQKDTNITIKDWKSAGDDIVIMAQKEGDSSLLKLYEYGHKSFYDWIKATIVEIKKYSDRKIIIRPHPKQFSIGCRKINELVNQFDNVVLSENAKNVIDLNQYKATLNDDLKNAYCVVTYNSLSAIESLCRGIPIFTMDNGSMAWPVSHHDVSQIENLDLTIDLQDWKNKVAYTIWHKSEIKRGEAWAHLKPVHFT